MSSLLERKLKLVEEAIVREEKNEVSAKVQLRELRKTQMEILDQLEKSSAEPPESLESMRINMIRKGMPE